MFSGLCVISVHVVEGWNELTAVISAEPSRRSFGLINAHAVSDWERENEKGVRPTRFL